MTKEIVTKTAKQTKTSKNNNLGSFVDQVTPEPKIILENFIDHLGISSSDINGSHTVMGEIIGVRGKPIVGIPVYDEQTNQIEWAQEHKLGIMANNTNQLVSGIAKIKDSYSYYEESISEYQKHFIGNGARTTAKIAFEMLNQDKR